MKFEPMLKVMIKDYQKSYGMDNVDEDIVFEYFVNHTILRSQEFQPFKKSCGIMVRPKQDFLRMMTDGL